MVARQYDEIKKRVEAACLRAGRSDLDRCQQDKTSGDASGSLRSWSQRLWRE